MAVGGKSGGKKFDLHRGRGWKEKTVYTYVGEDC